MNLPVFLISFALILLQLVALPAQAINNQTIFSSRLFDVILRKNRDHNFIISPASIQTVLALTYMGAESKTAKELKHALNLGNKSISKEDVAQQFRNLMVKVIGENMGTATLKMANRIYVQQGYEIQTKFNDIAQRYFESNAETVNFADNMNAAQKINSWVEEQTENKIQNMISPYSLNDDTAMILVNAIFLNATWLNDFKEELTTERDFYISKSRTEKVAMMHQVNDNFGYADFSGLDAKALSMKFLDTNIQMLVLLPNKLNELGRFENLLKFVDLTKLLTYLQEETLSVYLPKFKIEFDISLIPALRKLHIRRLFNPKANLSSLFTRDDVKVKVSEVKQKAFIEVDEKGTVAAGSTHVKIVGFSEQVVQPSHTINVNHPFFFALLDYETVYFTGHVVEI